ncbi:citrate synthase [Devosia sp. FJ2-5-3]|uniref:citrate synthase n=1 Tax=Devosia sp. FJ2-5-3 TaxID=2976680 RepID=UPI0023D89642|nr:citrate synthase [Devosia sp. FJ2-5-3]WEJ57767.1 citrate synthase [Devosia sp. FJ2-5-3]
MGWLSAEAALALLGTKPQTLYANVSRGRIAARPDPEDSRRSLYKQDDVERLAGRQRGRRPAQAVAAETIAWGEPVLETAISTVAGGRLFYRGQDAAALAEHAGLEAVAALLWASGSGGGFGASSPPPGLPLEGGGVGPVRFGGHEGLSQVYVDMAMLAATDMPTAGRTRAVLLRDAERVVGTVANALAGPGEQALHERLAQRWARPEAADVIRRALVLLAEHELNASTFAARVTASTGAPLSAAVLAGLAALSGPLHGNASQSMAGLLEQAGRLGVEAALAAHLRQGQALPCFGHRLYPDGDIRARTLMAAFEVPAVFAQLAEAGEGLSGERPNVDFALMAMSAAFDLPRDAPLQIFALGRSVGWIAHALEQVETGTLIRPRARYVGNPHPASP